MGRLLPAALVLLTALGAPDASRAAWQSPGTGAQAAKAVTLGGGNTPSGSVSNRSVAVSWTATTLPGGGSLTGYTVRRYTGAGVLQTIGSACSGTIAATSCTEAAVPPGTWRYSVQPLQGSWTGTDSALSSPVTVAAPSLSVTSGSPVGTLPGTVNATLAAFVPGQTITYRLDNAVSGTLLTASTVPSPIPAGGGATAAITIPAGTTGGSHTIHAIGSAGDTASAAIQVDLFATTGAWHVSDASSDTPADATAEPAVAGDSLMYRSDRFDTFFATSRYIDFDFAASLHPGQAVTGAAFTLRFAAQGVAHIACFYFEVRSASTGAVLGTHGSALLPVGCVTGLLQQTFTTSVAELTTSDLANDARVRVFVSQSASRAIDVDRATLGATVALTPVTLHAREWTDAADTSPATTTWPLAAEDATAYQVSANWATTFTAGRYLEVGFPAFVPAAATVRSATFRHVQRPANAGATACWYAEVWSGGSLIGTHGSAASPISCVTGAGWSADSVSLPEVNSPARANDLSVRIIERVTGSTNRRTQHDATELSVRYGG